MTEPTQPSTAIMGTVRDVGGGEVAVLVDRDTPNYPNVGDRVQILCLGRPVTVEESDLRHIIDVLTENGMVEQEDEPILNRLHAVLSKNGRTEEGEDS